MVRLDLQVEAGARLGWLRPGPGGVVLEARAPVIVESVGAATASLERVETSYGEVATAADGTTRARAQVVDSAGGQYLVKDEWSRLGPARWRLDRVVEVLAGHDGGLRVLLELSPGYEGAAGFEQLRWFAPTAMYDLNDLNGDHVDDYVDSQTLIYREDRLSGLTVLAYDPGERLAFSLSRATVPAFDPEPDRARGQTAFVQSTDIGSLGARNDGGKAVLVAAYPFVERERSHALLVRERPGWGAFWPARAGQVLRVSYDVTVEEAEGPHDALWRLWGQSLSSLAPTAVKPAGTFSEITRARLRALLSFYAEGQGGAAGFATNCHPQDAVQLGNVLQFGFTGQNLLNCYCVLRGEEVLGEEGRRAALRTIDFFVGTAGQNEHGFVRATYDMDRKAWWSWWTGLLLPLAYARDGAELEMLMGPLAEYLKPVIDALRGLEGCYLRCAAEEYDALLCAYELERQRGRDHQDWLQAALRFGRFLQVAQCADGSWYRAYDLEGRPLTGPDFWFGQTEVQRKSSTATVVPVLLALYRATGDGQWLAMASKAGGWVAQHCIDDLKFNGGIHDSIYAKPQLPDHESIIFAFRAVLGLYKATNDPAMLQEAIKAAQVAASWAWLWDVPLPPESTLARFGFRSTGWPGCDCPSAGYIHPMGIIVVPDLVEISLITGDDRFARVAELLFGGCNENVALPAKDWGYAREGLQEEGLLISWWLGDDPMFEGTGFGSRGKGEGNKTCYSWISAVTIWAHQELLDRYGTDDIRSIKPRAHQLKEG